jgi:hypothetical protein
MAERVHRALNQGPDGVLHFAHGVQPASIRAVLVQQVLVQQPVHGVQVLRVLQQPGHGQQRVVRVPQLHRVLHAVRDVNVDVRAPAAVGAVKVACIGQDYFVISGRVEVEELHDHGGLVMQ